MSTTIRVDTETHARLLELSKESGDSLTDTVRLAAEALRRLRLAQTVTEQLEHLRRRPDEWSDYLGEADSTSVADGVDR